MSVERLKRWRITCDGYVTNIDKCPTATVVDAKDRHDAYRHLATEGWRVNHEESAYPHLCPIEHHRYSDDAPVIFYEQNPLYDPDGRKLGFSEYEERRKAWHLANGSWLGGVR